MISRDKGGMDNVHAFQVYTDRGNSRFARPDKSKLVCSHCKQKGQEISTCFKIHGNPEWYEERLRARSAGKNDGGGTHTSGGVGESATSSGGTAGTVRGLVSMKAHVVADGNFGSSGSGGTSLANLTSEQIQVLMNLINNEQHLVEQMAGIQWIHDMGASHHITEDFSFFVNVRSIADCHVGILNGCLTIATMEGDVYLTNKLYFTQCFICP